MECRKISDIIEEKAANNQVWLSVEYFPPKTEIGVTNLYKLVDTLKNYNPIFADVTWGAGGSTSDLTFDLCTNMKEKHGQNPNMHLTCTNMEKQKVLDALQGCKTVGIKNIVALRGDPPAGQKAWEAVEGGFTCALDLVKFIRAEHGDYFCVSVAGYPEGHPNRMTMVKDLTELTDSELQRVAELTDDEGNIQYSVCKDADFEKELEYLKGKVDAGANCIITQLFFDADVFTIFVKRCREFGIVVPIIPGIMCIAAAGGFKRMIKFCKTRVPKSLMDMVDSVKDDDEMKVVGANYCTNMCRRLLDEGAVGGLHFYTLNAGHVTIQTIKNLLLLGYNISGAGSLVGISTSTVVGPEAVNTVFTPKTVV